MFTVSILESEMLSELSNEFIVFYLEMETHLSIFEVWMIDAQ